MFSSYCMPYSRKRTSVCMATVSFLNRNRVQMWYSSLVGGLYPFPSFSSMQFVPCSLLSKNIIMLSWLKQLLPNTIFWIYAISYVATKVCYSLQWVNPSASPNKNQTKDFSKLNSPEPLRIAMKAIQISHNLTAQKDFKRPIQANETLTEEIVHASSFMWIDFMQRYGPGMLLID